MATIPVTSSKDKVDKRSASQPAAVIDLEEFREAQRDPRVKALLEKAAAEGERVEREGRIHW